MYARPTRTRARGVDIRDDGINATDFGATAQNQNTFWPLRMAAFHVPSCLSLCDPLDAFDITSHHRRSRLVSRSTHKLPPIAHFRSCHSNCSSPSLCLTLSCYTEYARLGVARYMIVPLYAGPPIKNLCDGHQRLDSTLCVCTPQLLELCSSAILTPTWPRRCRPRRSTVRRQTTPARPRC